MIAALYNENSAYFAAWLRNISAAGLVCHGDIDARDVRDVPAADLAGYGQVHLFAGIGMWSHALRLAGWGDDRAVWTCSCPCQPFSAAGRRGGIFDDRHLWPAAHWLISQCRPVTIFGEQVASPDGRAWLDIVSADLEALGYTCGAVALCSAGVGAPNIRERLFWVALSDGERRDQGRRGHATQEHGLPRGGCPDGRLGRPDGIGPSAGPCEPHAGHEPGQSQRSGDARGLGDAASMRRAGIAWQEVAHGTDVAITQPHPWCEPEWNLGTDGRWRPFESGAQRLVAGYSAGVGIPRAFPLSRRQAGDTQKLSAYGNAINPYVAAQFIRAYMTEKGRGL